MEEGLGAKEGGGEWEAPGCPRVQVKVNVDCPPCVDRLRLASPPKAQICMNSFTVAPRNWEFDLTDIFANLGKVTVGSQDHLVSFDLKMILINKGHIMEVAG